MKKNIIVCGYPKSGTTWATRLVAQLLDCEVKGYWGEENEAISSEGSDRKSDFVCFHAHQYFSSLSLDSSETIFKIVYVVRDPRDVVVSGIYHFSFYHHFVKKLENALGQGIVVNLIKKIDRKISIKRYKVRRMIHMIFNGDPTIDHCDYVWDEHVRSFLNQTNVLLLRYEDLLHNGIESAVKILDHCGKSKKVESIEDDIHSQSFQVKKKQFKQTKDKVREKHLRSGVSGDWKKELDSQYIQVIESRLGSTMRELKYL